jgi:hypothetical protein
VFTLSHEQNSGSFHYNEREQRDRGGERGAVPSGLVDDEAVASMVSTAAA